MKHVFISLYQFNTRSRYSFFFKARQDFNSRGSDKNQYYPTVNRSLVGLLVDAMINRFFNAYFTYMDSLIGRKNPNLKAQSVSDKNIRTLL